MKPKIIFISFICLFVVLIILQNTQVVEFQFLAWKFSMSRIILLPLIFLSGLVVGFVLGKKSF